METTFQNARVIAEQREGCERRQRDLEAALGELDRQEAEWRSQWSEAAGVIGLREEADDEEAEAALSIWQAVPALEASMRDLEHRIERIEQDGMAFREAAAKLCAAVAPDLGDSDPVAASAALRQRLVEARQAATTRAGLNATLAELEDKSGERRRHAQLNDSELAALCTGAGVAEPDELGALADRIEQDSSCQASSRKERKALLDAADGLGEAELRAELARSDPDGLSARLQELADEQEDLEGRLGEAIRIETRAEANLEDIETRAGAAAAAQDEQNALADIAGSSRPGPVLRRPNGCFRPPSKPTGHSTRTRFWNAFQGPSPSPPAAGSRGSRSTTTTPTAIASSRCAPMARGSPSMRSAKARPTSCSSPCASPPSRIMPSAPGPCPSSPTISSSPLTTAAPRPV
jgi:hypothetical protein